MAKIFIAWEFGGGLGHVVPLRALGEELVRRGHEVVVAVEPSHAPLCRQALDGTGAEIRTGPPALATKRQPEAPCTYAGLLHACGYWSRGQVADSVRGWLELLDQAQPDLLLGDHAPTALLAGRVRGIAAAAIGTGYTCPPDTEPLPSLRPAIPRPPWADEVERSVLETMNAALADHGGPPLDRVGRLFSDLLEVFLLTCKELDHYADWRPDHPRPPRYSPPIGALPGAPCDWPAAPGKNAAPVRALVCLRDPATEVPLLRGLAYKGVSTVCFSAHMDDASRDAFAGSSVLVSPTPVDLSRLLPTCSAAVCHGGHGLVCELIEQGAPMLIVPTTLEQQVTADRVAELGIGLQAPLGDLNALGAALEELLDNDQHRTAAEALSRQLWSGAGQPPVVAIADNIEWQLNQRK